MLGLSGFVGRFRIAVVKRADSVAFCGMALPDMFEAIVRVCSFLSDNFPIWTCESCMAGQQKEGASCCFDFFHNVYFL